MTARHTVVHTPPSTPMAIDGAADLWAHRPDRHLRIVEPDGRVAATASTWSATGATLDGARVGMIGHFTAVDEPAAVRVLAEAAVALRRDGSEVAVGPIDGSTWRRYRLVVDGAPAGGPREDAYAGAPPFLMEPRNPPEWPRWWRSAGFAPCATYHSSVCAMPVDAEARVDDAAARPRRARLTLRPLDTAHAERELERVHALCEESFVDNLLYAPLPLTEFLAMYAPLLPRLAPGMVLLADDPEERQRLAGFIMTVPDSSTGATSGMPGTPDTLILKSMAVRPSWRSVGLGGWLIAESIANAHRLGLRRVIFALMRDDNPSARIGRHYATVMRRYALLRRELGR